MATSAGQRVSIAWDEGVHHKLYPEADLSAYQDYYIQHLLDQAAFYEQLTFDLSGGIQCNILLHHNFLDASR